MLNCPVCNIEIPEERIEILRGLNYKDHDIYCVKHAINRPVKGIYSGEVGTSELILCSRVYNDSVRTKLLNSEETTDDNDENFEIEKNPDLD